MIHIAIAFLLSALWIIFTPYSLGITILLIIVAIGLFLAALIYHGLKDRVHYASFFALIGILLGCYLYSNELQKYQLISENLPLTINAKFRIKQKNDYSTTIILQSIDNVLTTHQSFDKKTRLKEILEGREVTLYSANHLLSKKTSTIGQNFSAKLQILPRTYRNIPGNSQQVLRYLGHSNIGYGEILSRPSPTQSASAITEFRYKISNYLMDNFTNGAYLSALSVGITDHLTPKDWQILRRTGTIHLVSISGLHLSLTAFYAFIIFRIVFGLTLPRFWISPYKSAAFLAIFIAWGYTLLAGSSLPTIRAAIMFSIAMLTLILDRPIFSFQSLAVALLVILLIMPLSIVTAGFWLSFSAVTILVVCAQRIQSPLATLLLTQLIISLLLIPLSIAFFGEFSLISPIINLFAISWTATMIMPFLLIGVVLLFFTSTIAAPFLSIANQAIWILIIAIDSVAELPFAYIKTAKISFILSVIITTFLIIILYFSNKIIKHLNVFWHHLKYLSTSSIKRSILLVFLPFCLFSSSTMTLKNTNYEQVKIYLLPVGEGLSVLLHSKELTFLYDTGNRFRQFDAGKQIIIPSLQNLNIQNIDYIILSNDNWQHIGGNRTIRGNFPEARMLAYSKLLPFLDKGFSCESFYYGKQNILIEAITTFSTSCGFKVTLFDHTELYLISDITKIEWLQFTSEVIQEEKIKNSNLSRKKDYFEQEEFIHSSKIFLFPHQGKRNYPMRELLQNFSDITFLFSTKRIDTKVSQQLSKTGHSIYNAYYGVIEISIPKINAKPYRRFRIKEFSDKKRFWWYSPIH